MSNRRLPAFGAREIPPEHRSKMLVGRYVPVDPKDPNSKNKLIFEEKPCNVRQYDVRLPRGNRVRLTEDQMERLELDPRNPYRVPPELEITDTGNEMMLSD